MYLLYKIRDEARERGFEPRSKVLETSILPLNYSRRKVQKLKSQKNHLLTFEPDGKCKKRNLKKLLNFLLKGCCRIKKSSLLRNREDMYYNQVKYYLMMLVTCPAPTVRPPSRIANLRPFSIAIGAINFTVRLTLSPGITISTPAGREHSPVTSVVRK